LNNFGLLCFCLALGLYAGKEFIDWFWWYYWNDDEDEQNPAPVLCTTWWVWEWMGKVRFWVWLKIWRHVEHSLWAIRRHFSPPQLPDEPVDRDGRTPVEWLLIAIVGAWELYKGDYDQNIKRKWDEYLKARNGTETPDASEAPMDRSEPRRG
jgi:hypothetical protein